MFGVIERVECRKVHPCESESYASDRTPNQVFDLDIERVRRLVPSKVIRIFDFVTLENISII